MANAMLFYRTPTTRIVDSGFGTPALLLANAPAQCLLFTPPNDLAARLIDNCTNNIVRKPPPEPFSRRIRQTDEGVAGWLITVEGNFIGAVGDAAAKLHNFWKLPQGDTYHVFGVFGITYPNGPSYIQTIDPAATKGLMITNKQDTHVGLTKEIVDFSIQLSYGGDV